MCNRGILNLNLDDRTSTAVFLMGFKHPRIMALARRESLERLSPERSRVSLKLHEALFFERFLRLL